MNITAASTPSDDAPALWPRYAVAVLLGYTATASLAALLAAM